MDKRKYLKPQYIADTLDVKLPTALKLLREGTIPAVLVRSGQRKSVYRVRPEAFEAWLKRRETRAVE